MRTKLMNLTHAPAAPGLSAGCVDLPGPRVSSVNPLSETTIRTLVVDDSPIILKVLSQVLEDLGDFDIVGTAPDGCKALRYVMELAPELVLMDNHMPHLNGLQATQYIKQFEHPPIVIIISSDDSPASMEMAKNAGADAFVVKGANVRHRLTGVLQELLGSIYANRKRADAARRPINTQ